MGFTAFMAVLVPIYWVHYGPANFLYFCDVALFLALAAVWTERPIFASMAAVGVLVPQLLWCRSRPAPRRVRLRWIDRTTCSMPPSPSTCASSPSSTAGFPFMLIFIVARLGYDRRALKGWTIAAVFGSASSVTSSFRPPVRFPSAARMPSM